MKQPISSEKVLSPRGFYSHAVRSGSWLFVSGQLPLTLKGELVDGGIEVQTKQTLENLAHILSEAGSSIHDLVQVTIYVVDISLWSRVDAVYREFCKNLEFAPARVTVPVKDLHYGSLIEIQATAHVQPSSTVQVGS